MSSKTGENRFIALLRKQVRKMLQARRSSPAYIEAKEVKPFLDAIKPFEGKVRTVSRRLLVIPSDIDAFSGARGDDAMVTATTESLRAAFGALEIAAIVGSDSAAARVMAKGFTPIDTRENGTFSYSRTIAGIAEFAPDLCFVLGADVLDGYYWPASSARMLLMADAVARFGGRVSVLGFSFNSTPAPGLRPVFHSLHENVSLHLRDHLSQARFYQFTGIETELVADSAFLLEPDFGGAHYPRIAAFAERARTSSRGVIALNLHPLLIKDITPETLDRLTSSAARAVESVSSHRGLAWIFLPHDDRDGIGDVDCLRMIYDKLPDHLRQDVLLMSEVPQAAQIKAIVGVADYVVAGRMHLAIACLGREIPTMVVTYQDKFQGLFDHFGLPSELALAPADALHPERLSAAIERLIRDKNDMREKIASRLPQVMALSRKNIAPLLERLGREPPERKKT